MAKNQIFVNIPKHGWAIFPANMPLEKIKAESKKLHLAASKPKSSTLGNILHGAGKGMK